MSPEVFAYRPVPLVTVNFPLPFEYPLRDGVDVPRYFPRSVEPSWYVNPDLLSLGVAALDRS